jgi:hypothetical protein
MPWFTFSQNNSGGSFVLDKGRGLTHYVAIEARDAEHANERAQSIGIYFNGCDDDRDCPCCGDRWYELWSDEKGSDEPEHYGTPLKSILVKEEGEKFTPMAWMEDGFEAVIHPLEPKGEPFTFLSGKEELQ